MSMPTSSPAPTRFLADVMCGRLVSYLRMCGYDTLYAGDRELEADDEVLAVADREERTVLTRDVELAGRADDAVLLESRDLEDQLAELRRAGVDLRLAAEPVRCGRCNGRLERVRADAESGPGADARETPEYAPDPGDEPVWRCATCGQHFWKGSHWDRVGETLIRVSSAGGDESRLSREHDESGSSREDDSTDDERERDRGRDQC